LFQKTGILGQFMAKRLNLFLLGLTRQGSVRPLSPVALDGWRMPYRLPILRQAIGRFVQDIPLAPNHPSWSSLARVDQDFDGLADRPTFLVWGLRDFVFSPAFLADFRARRPKAAVLALPYAGHLALEDEPEKIVAAVRRFLAQARRSTGPEVL
jgi:haloalkane dehalogenase